MVRVQTHPPIEANLVLLLILGILQTFDVFATRHFIDIGIAIESNPLVDYFVTTMGWMWVLAYKLCLCAILAGCIFIDKYAKLLFYTLASIIIATIIFTTIPHCYGFLFVK